MSDQDDAKTLELEWAEVVALFIFLKDQPLADQRLMNIYRKIEKKLYNNLSLVEIEDVLSYYLTLKD